MTQNIRIVSWNCHQLSTVRKLAVLHALDLLQIDILCLQEANGATLRHPDYLSIQPHPDLLILIKHTLSFSILQHVTDHECIVSALRLKDICLVFCYLRNGKHLRGMQRLLDLLTTLHDSYPKIFAIGDMNTHDNSAGRALDKGLGFRV